MSKRKIKPKLGNASTRAMKTEQKMCLHCGKHPRKVLADGTLSIWCDEMKAPSGGARCIVCKLDDNGMGVAHDPVCAARNEFLLRRSRPPRAET